MYLHCASNSIYSHLPQENKHKTISILSMYLKNHMDEKQGGKYAGIYV